MRFLVLFATLLSRLIVFLFQIAPRTVDRLIITLTPSLNFFYGLIPSSSRATMIQQNLEHFPCFISLFSFFIKAQFDAVYLRIIVSALPSFLFDFFSSSKGSFLTSNKLSVQPSDSYFMYFGFESSSCFFTFLSFLRMFHKERFKGHFERFKHPSKHCDIK